MSFTSQSEAQAGAHVGAERGEAEYFVVALVERVLDVHRGGDAPCGGEPSAEVHARVAGGMIDVEALKVGVWPPTHKAAARVPSPAPARANEQHAADMLRPS